MKQDWIYLQELICYWLAALICVALQLCLSKLATSVIIHGMGPQQIPDSFLDPRESLDCTLQVVRMLTKMQDQSPELLRPWGRDKAPILLCRLLYLCTLPLPKRALQARETS